MSAERATRARRAEPAYRRSRGLVAYWNSSGLICFDCISGRRFAVVPEVLTFLDALGDWTTTRTLIAQLSSAGATLDVRGSLRSLSQLGLIDRAGTDTPWNWEPWMPEAAFFHFATRASRFLADPREQDTALRAKAAHTPPPAPTKTTAGSRIKLPDPQPDGQLTEILKARRTWRNFSGESVPLEAIATVLQLTWGVQRRGRVDGQGPVVLKTSPSGGARHPIEAYLLVSNVRGLRSGAYHYDAATHELVDLRRTMSAGRLEQLLGNQDYYRDAAALVVMTAVIARSMWKYPMSRAYRTILLDAGHLGQTFCLTATALGLAPFCTMAFQERQVEQLLRVDGVTECAMYVVGLGARAPAHAARPGQIHQRRRAR